MNNILVLHGHSQHKNSNTLQIARSLLKTLISSICSNGKSPSVPKRHHNWSHARGVKQKVNFSFIVYNEVYNVMYREKNSKTDSLKLLGHTAVERFCLCHVHVCLYNTYKYLLQNAILYYSYLYVCNNIEFCQRWYVVDSVFLGAFPDHVTYKVCRIMQIIVGR